MRNMLKALLRALLEPYARLQAFERAGDYSSRLAYLEELKAMPWQAVWDEFCVRENVPVGLDWYEEVRSYEENVLSKR